MATLCVFTKLLCSVIFIFECVSVTCLSQILVRVFTEELCFHMPIFAVFVQTWINWLVLDRNMMCLFVLSPKSLNAAISLRSVSLAMVALNRGGRNPNLVPMVWFFISWQDSAHSGSASWSFFQRMLCFRFAVGKTIFAFTANPGHDDSLNNCLLDSMARVHTVYDTAVFVVVGDANDYHSEWLEWVSSTDRHGRDTLGFCNLSGCEQLVQVELTLLVLIL